MSARARRLDWDGAWWGVLLLAFGAGFLLMNLGIIDRSWLSDWWAFIPGVLGVARLVMARSAKAVSEGVFMVILSAWFVVAVTGWRGFTWHNSWPIMLIAVGASAIAEAVAGMFLPRRKPGEAECGS